MCTARSPLSATFTSPRHPWHHTAGPAGTPTNDLAAAERRDTYNPHALRVFSPPRFRAYRHVRAFAHHQVAASVGTTAQTIEQVETGALAPRPAMVGALANALGCTVNDLTTTGDPLDNDQYWEAACVALPPLSDQAVQSVAATLDRVDTRAERRAHRLMHPR